MFLLSCAQSWPATVLPAVLCLTEAGCLFPPTRRLIEACRLFGFEAIQAQAAPVSVGIEVCSLIFGLGAYPKTAYHAGLFVGYQLYFRISFSLRFPFRWQKVRSSVIVLAVLPYCRRTSQAPCAFEFHLQDFWILNCLLPKIGRDSSLISQSVRLRQVILEDFGKHEET